MLEISCLRLQVLSIVIYPQRETSSFCVLILAWRHPRLGTMHMRRFFMLDLLLAFWGCNASFADLSDGFFIHSRSTIMSPN